MHGPTRPNGDRSKIQNQMDTGLLYALNQSFPNDQQLRWGRMQKPPVLAETQTHSLIMKNLLSKTYAMKARLLCALAGIVCAALVYALLLHTQEQVMAETAVPNNHFIRLRAPQCDGPDMCQWANGCIFPCGMIPGIDCCTAEGYFPPACELCEMVVTP